MRSFNFSVLFLAFVLLGEVVLAGAPHKDPAWKKRRHSRLSVADDAVVDGTVDDLTRRNETVESRSLHSFEKRFSGGRFTFYDAGLGACGRVNSNSDFIVALNAVQWAGGAHCFEQITITANGKSTQATIVDLCPGCEFASLDFSRGLFDFFASQDVGVITTGSWTFGAGTPAPPPPPPPPAPPRPSSPPLGASTPTSTTSTSALSTSSPTSSSSSPTATAGSVSEGNVQQLWAVFGQLGGIVVAGAN